jgi:hypothetical protein
MCRFSAALGSVAFCLLLSLRATAQPVYYNTSSSTLANNTLRSVATNGANNTILFTANGAVSRCTAMAVDALDGKLFLVDGQSNAIWSVNLSGTGAALIKSGLTNFPTDLALDVLNQRIYFTTSSTVQGNNTVQAINYDGTGAVTLFTATGSSGNGVSRCTALALDLSNSKLFLADAGAQKIWSLNLGGGGLAPLAATTNCFPTGVAVNPASQQVYFTASSALQASNSIQRVNYNGSGLATVFTASGAVQRCTALDLDLTHSSIYLSDAGASALWRIPLAGGSAVSVVSALPAAAKRVRWYGGPNSRSAPGITGIQLSSTEVLLNATNGFIGGTYYVLTSTNLATPLNQWLPISTNVLSATGSFTLTNPLNSALPQQFYILGVQ